MHLEGFASELFNLKNPVDECQGCFVLTCIWITYNHNWCVFFTGLTLIFPFL